MKDTLLENGNISMRDTSAGGNQDDTLSLNNVNTTLSRRLESINISYQLLIFILVAVDVLGLFATDAQLPSLPDIAKDLNCSSSWVQLTVLLYTIIMSFASLFGGIISDKYGRRIATNVGLLTFFIGNVGCIFSPNIIMLNISRVVQGIGGGMSNIVTNSVARDVFESQERLKVLGILGSIRPVAIAGAPMIGGWIGQLFGWRYVFVMTAIVSLLIFCLTLTKLPETRDKFFTQSRIDLIADQEPIARLSINNGSGSGSDGIIGGDGFVDYGYGDYVGGTEQMFRRGSDIDHIGLRNVQNQDKNSLLIALNDYVFVMLSIANIFQWIGIAMYLNTFSFVIENKYGFSNWVTGIFLGVGALFLIIGSFGATTMSSKYKMKEFSILRIGCFVALISALMTLIPPLIKYFLTASENGNMKSCNNGNFIKCYDHIMNDTEWYWILIPFCIYTISQGIVIPPTNVIQLEPYPNIAGAMSGIAAFVMFVFSYTIVIIVTQLLNTQESSQPVVIHLTLFICGIVIFVIGFGLLNKTRVNQRMMRVSQ